MEVWAGGLVVPSPGPARRDGVLLSIQNDIASRAKGQTAGVYACNTDRRPTADKTVGGAGSQEVLRRRTATLPTHT